MATSQDLGGLLSAEVYWRDRYEWLQRSGYNLRPRYDPKWEPSWKKTGKSRFKAEDGISVIVSRHVLSHAKQRDSRRQRVRKHWTLSDPKTGR